MIELEQFLAKSGKKRDNSYYAKSIKSACCACGELFKWPLEKTNFLDKNKTANFILSEGLAIPQEDSNDYSFEVGLQIGAEEVVHEEGSALAGKLNKVNAK